MIGFVVAMIEIVVENVAKNEKLSDEELSDEELSDEKLSDSMMSGEQVGQEVEVLTVNMIEMMKETDLVKMTEMRTLEDVHVAMLG